MTRRVDGVARSRRGHAVIAAMAAGALLLALAPAGSAHELSFAERPPARARADAGPHRVPGTPVAPVEIELEQPDGATFDAVAWGDRSLHGFETPDGYTVVQAPSGEWRYAEGREPDGELEPGSTTPDDADPPVRTPEHQRPATSTAAVIDDPSLETTNTIEPARAPFVGNIGEQPTLVILARFSDRGPVGTSAGHWARRFFGDTASVRDYYDEVSYGQLDLAPAAESSRTAGDGVVGWVDVSYDHPNSGPNFETGWQDDLELARKAIVAANPFVDYAAFDVDDDGVIAPAELHVVVIAAGYETSYSGPAPSASCGPSVWGHNYELFGLTPTVDGVSVGGDGGGYSMFGEYHCMVGYDDPGAPASIGIMVHELGHDLGLPDLYDVDYSSVGVGSWSLMASGSWTSASPQDRLGSSPVHPDAWSKVAQGWVEPQEIGGPTWGVALDQAATSPDIAQVLPNPGGVDWRFGSEGTGDYFLVENRQPVGYDAGLPGCGLLVWHVNESQPGNNLANSVDWDRLVDLEEADGLSDLDDSTNLGDAGDPYPGSRPNFWFGPLTNPRSETSTHHDSGVQLWPVSESCSPTMVADIAAPTSREACPPDDGFEPNDTPEGATPITSGSIEGALCAGDVDYFVVETTTAGRLEARLDYAAALGNLDVSLTELSSGETGTWRPGTLPEAVYFDDVQPGSFLVAVSTPDSSQQAYTLAVDTPDVPDRPSGVTAQLQNQAVKVSWYAPFWTAGSSLTYNVTASPGGQTCEVAQLRTCTVTGLTNGTRYAFTVVATSLSGSSGPSLPSAYVTPSALPGRPTGVTGNARDGSVEVTWQPPASNGGSRIHGYRVTASPGGAICETAIGTSCTMTGLSNGTPYTFTVRAANAAGDSPLSLPTPPVTPGAVPGKPTAVTGVARDRAVRVSWVAPTSSGDSALTSYVVTASPGGSTCTSSGALSCIVPGLTNGTPHTFTVRAANTFGAGLSSRASGSVTPRAVPGAPRNVRLTAAARTVRVEWAPPVTDGGAAILRYVAKASPGGYTCEAIATDRVCTIRGLPTGQRYAVRVRAVNVAGAGAWSAERTVGLART